MNAERGEQRPLDRFRHRSPRSNAQGDTVGRAVNGQCHNQRARDFAKMLRCVCVEVTGRAGGADMMDVFADEEEQRVSGRGRQRYRPPRTVAQTFGQNGEEGYAEQCSGRQADQRTKGFVRQWQRSADRPTNEGESIGRDDLPESQFAIQEVVSDS